MAIMNDVKNEGDIIQEIALEMNPRKPRVVPDNIRENEATHPP